ncbi:RND transporter [Salinigranum rubrum]|uniref:RND transporter n=1 Tax=Salinigranum rubrum TaxID=755307 RepID=A0A2I8VLN4_9EURY|nr:MMPL family transporter [Salinigranum rubrum]AUV82842.1 RND transporter [Salinigranum rubrum]
MRHQQIIDRVDDWIVNRPKAVILTFLVVTLVMSSGLAMTATESGTDQFTEDIPAQEAADEINEQFETESFTAETASTQLIQSNSNVLSKSSMLRMLEAQHRLEETPDQRVVATASVARVVAQDIDPEATTLDEQIDALERTPASTVREHTRSVLRERPGLVGLLSEDYNRESVTASATIATVTHSLPGASDSSGGGGGGDSPATDIQLQAEDIVGTVGGDIRVFGSGLISAEFGNVIGDSLLIVVPAAVTLIFVFLVYAYRDPLDLLVGVVSLAMAILWTFGFMGLAGIAFTQMLIAVPPLLLAVGIDFGIHAVNRYREERVQGIGIVPSMRTATDQLLVAFFIVTGTTVIGFSANLTSALPPIQDFGLVAGIGIIFTFLIFGIFLPAAKVYADQWRARTRFPQFGSQPLGSEDSVLGRILPVGVSISRVAPRLFLLVLVVSTSGLAYYGTGVDSRFTQESFLPPEDNPDWLESLPEPFAPSEYDTPETINYLEDTFESGEDDQVTVYVEGPLRQDDALEQLYRMGDDPPESFVSRDGRADSTSIVTVIREQAARDEEFAALVRRNDANRNGIPDDNLETVYDALLSSPARDRALNYITEDYRSARVQYAVQADAEQADVTRDAREVASGIRFEATATGTIIVFKAVSDVITESALTSLAIALAATLVFLVGIYWLIEGRPLLGVANTVPIAVTVAAIAASMRYGDIPLNALTGTILSIAIGLGIDYSAHVVHRFSEEFDDDGDVYEALEATVRGTGGALTGSMLTTVTGIGVLVLAITPILGQFGLLTGLSILYSFLASIIVLPSTLVVWARLTGRGGTPSDASSPADATPSTDGTPSNA